MGRNNSLNTCTYIFFLLKFSSKINIIFNKFVFENYSQVSLN